MKQNKTIVQEPPVTETKKLSAGSALRRLGLLFMSRCSWDRRYVSEEPSRPKYALSRKSVGLQICEAIGAPKHTGDVVILLPVNGPMAVELRYYPNLFQVKGLASILAEYELTKRKVIKE